MSTFTIHRGTNIAHFLSQSKARGAQRKGFFTREDVQRIKGWGFDHVRLPIDEEQMWSEDGQREREAFDLLHGAIAWCEEAGLKVIVDLHILRSHHFNDADEPRLYSDANEQQRFANLWRDLSDELGQYPSDLVAYELLNEPVARDDAKWNEVYRFPYEAIREREPGRKIVLGSNWFQTTDRFPMLAIPDDPELILSFHFYHPMFITHYRAGWTPCGRYEGAIQYPGRPMPDEEVARLDPEYRKQLDAWHGWNEPGDRAMMIERLQPVLARRSETGLPLYCGEFGVISHTPRDLAVAWYRDFVSVLDELDIPYANWCYRGSFGIVDGDGRDMGILEAVLGRGG